MISGQIEGANDVVFINVAYVTSLDVLTGFTGVGVGCRGNNCGGGGNGGDIGILT